MQMRIKLDGNGKAKLAFAALLIDAVPRRALG
jgi:hypothetical protein